MSKVQTKFVNKKIYANYDWDDNVMFMPTRIVFFSKNNVDPKEIEVSTETFAHVRSKVGTESCILFLSLDGDVVVGSLEPSTPVSKSVDLLNYEVRPEDNSGSFRQFRDCGKNYFQNDLNKALKAKSFGPSFNDFVEHCETQELANNTTIITARGHSPETMHKGLVRLQELGFIKFVPPVGNLFPCSYKGLKATEVASAQNPSDAKKNIILSILDRINTNAQTSDKASDELHTFGFSDDDKKTMVLVQDVLSKELQTGRWSGFEINLYFTGNKKKERQVLLSKHSNVVKVTEVA